MDLGISLRRKPFLTYSVMETQLELNKLESKASNEYLYLEIFKLYFFEKSLRESLLRATKNRFWVKIEFECLLKTKANKSQPIYWL